MHVKSNFSYRMDRRLCLKTTNRSIRICSETTTNDERVSYRLRRHLCACSGQPCRRKRNESVISRVRIATRSNYEPDRVRSTAAIGACAMALRGHRRQDEQRRNGNWQTATEKSRKPQSDKRISTMTCDHNVVTALFAPEMTLPESSCTTA